MADETELTEHEKSCLRSLKRLAKKWKKAPNRLWLYSASGSLWVMVKGNDTIIRTHDHGVPEFVFNPDASLDKIDIPNDGGDW